MKAADHLHLLDPMKVIEQVHGLLGRRRIERQRLHTRSPAPVTGALGAIRDPLGPLVALGRFSRAEPCFLLRPIPHVRNAGQGRDLGFLDLVFLLQHLHRFVPGQMVYPDAAKGHGHEGGL
jgi:hypothetical protein